MPGSGVLGRQALCFMRLCASVPASTGLSAFFRLHRPPSLIRFFLFFRKRPQSAVALSLSSMFSILCQRLGRQSTAGAECGSCFHKAHNLSRKMDETPTGRVECRKHCAGVYRKNLEPERRASSLPGRWGCTGHRVLAAQR